MPSQYPPRSMLLLRSMDGWTGRSARIVALPTREKRERERERESTITTDGRRRRRFTFDRGVTDHFHHLSLHLPLISAIR